MALWQWVAVAEDARLVYCHPVLDLARPSYEGYTGVLAEVVGDLVVEPSAIGELKVKWEVPVIESNYWSDAVLETCVDYVVVVLETGFIDIT